MSKAVFLFLKQNPIITHYAQMKMVNITALSQHIKEKSKEIATTTSIAAIGMNIRRYLARLPKIRITSLPFSGIPLKLVIRTNIHEVIFAKTEENRQHCAALFEQIYRAKLFSCLVEGEKEIVIITDYSLNDLLKKYHLVNKIANQTSGLGFISIDFPIKLREMVGVYHHLTSALLLANIAIHSFHTIGGEIFILVKNEDVLEAQEVLTTALHHSD